MIFYLFTHYVFSSGCCFIPTAENSAKMKHPPSLSSSLYPGNANQTALPRLISHSSSLGINCFHFLLFVSVYWTRHPLDSWVGVSQVCCSLSLALTFQYAFSGNTFFCIFTFKNILSAVTYIQHPFRLLPHSATMNSKSCPPISFQIGQFGKCFPSIQSRVLESLSLE